MPAYFNKNEGVNIFKMNNFTDLTIDANNLIDSIGDVTGDETTATLIKSLGEIMQITFSYVIQDEASSVVSGSSDPATLTTAMQQLLYLLNTLRSSGTSQITDQYRITLEFATAAVSRTATGGSSTTLVDAGATWTTNQYQWWIVKITGGTGNGQWRQIISNTATTLTVASTTGEQFGTPPDNTSTYQIIQGLERVGALTKITPVMTSDQPLTFRCTMQFTVGTVT